MYLYTRACLIDWFGLLLRLKTNLNTATPIRVTIAEQIIRDKRHLISRISPMEINSERATGDARYRYRCTYPFVRLLRIV